MKKNNEVIADVSYALTVIETILIPEVWGSQNRVEGIGEIKGTFRIIDEQAKVKPDEVYTLELSDGREIDIMTPPLIIPDTETKIFVRDAGKFHTKK